MPDFKKHGETTVYTVTGSALDRKWREAAQKEYIDYILKLPLWSKAKSWSTPAEAACEVGSVEACVSRG